HLALPITLIEEGSVRALAALVGVGDRDVIGSAEGALRDGQHNLIARTMAALHGASRAGFSIAGFEDALRALWAGADATLAHAARELLAEGGASVPDLTPAA